MARLTKGGGIIAKISVTSRIVINMPTRELLVSETKSSFVKLFEHLNNTNNVYKQNLRYIFKTVG